MVISKIFSITFIRALKLKRVLKVMEKTLMRGFVVLECLLTRLCVGKGWAMGVGRRAGPPWIKALPSVRVGHEGPDA